MYIVTLTGTLLSLDILDIWKYLRLDFRDVDSSGRPNCTIDFRIIKLLLNHAQM